MEPEDEPVWPKIWPICGGNVILTLACISNLAEWSWLARWAAAASACWGVSALASGEAQAATAIIVNRLRKSRFMELPEYIDGGTPIPS